MNGGLVVVTLGRDGALAYDGSTVVTEGGIEVRMVDPVGAGDAFVAGLTGAIIRRMTPRRFLAVDASVRLPVLRDALRTANVCGALMCTRQRRHRRDAHHGRGRADPVRDLLLTV